MISIQKDLINIPGSLKVDDASILHDPAKTTHERRKELIADGTYPPSGSQSAPYDRRYKHKDIKDAFLKLEL